MACGRTMGHGLSCVEGYECSTCVESALLVDSVILLRKAILSGDQEKMDKAIEETEKIEYNSENCRKEREIKAKKLVDQISLNVETIVRSLETIVRPPLSQPSPEIVTGRGNAMLEEDLRTFQAINKVLDEKNEQNEQNETKND